MSDLSKSSIIYFNGVKVEDSSVINELFTIDETLQEITKERTEQIVVHNHRLKDDVFHNPNEELIQAARALLKPNPTSHDFPEHWGIAYVGKLMLKPYTKRLIIAAALLAAEVDRRKYIQKVMRERHDVSNKPESYHPLTPNECFKTDENG